MPFMISARRPSSKIIVLSVHARSSAGVIVEKGSVIATGTFIDPSTKIYDRATGEITYARIPAGSVVVPGNLPAADGTHSLSRCHRQAGGRSTRSKLGINEWLRGI